MTTPTSWPYFSRAVTVGVGLNAQTTAELATEKWNGILSGTGCDGFECLRGKTAQELRNAIESYGRAKPIKLILDSDYYSPVVDGVSLLDQLVNLVGAGSIRPNTPISFNYAEHDAFSFTAGGFNGITKVPLLSDQSQAIDDAVQNVSFKNNYSGFTLIVPALYRSICPLSFHLF